MNQFKSFQELPLVNKLILRLNASLRFHLKSQNRLICHFLLLKGEVNIKRLSVQCEDLLSHDNLQPFLLSKLDESVNDW